MIAPLPGVRSLLPTRSAAPSTSASRRNQERAATLLGGCSHRTIDRCVARAADVPVTLGGETVTVDGTMTLRKSGTAAIGKLAANSGVDIGDVDVLSLPPLAASSEVIGQVKRADAGRSAGLSISLRHRPLPLYGSRLALAEFVLTKLWYSASAAATMGHLRSHRHC